MATLSNLQSFKEHEAHFFLLLQSQDLHPSVQMAILGIEEWLQNKKRHERTKFKADSDPWTKDTLWATWGIDRITAATTSSQAGPPLAKLQCQLLRVLYHLLASQLQYASIELEKLGKQLKGEIPQSGPVDDGVGGVFWSYMILERYVNLNTDKDTPLMPLNSYSLLDPTDPTKQIWYLSCTARINLPAWDAHPAMQRFREKHTALQHHLLVRQFFISKELNTESSTSHPGDLSSKLQEMVDLMHNNAAFCSLESAGAMMLLYKPFLTSIHLHEIQVDTDFKKQLAYALFWATLVTKKAQTQHVLQRKQSLQL